MDSILDTVKTLLGIQPEYTHFDNEIILNINSTMMTLNQLGVGPTEGFFITGSTQTWKDFIGDRKDIDAVKILVYLKTRLTFDPPQPGYLVDAITKQIDEISWRLILQTENVKEGLYDG